MLPLPRIPIAILLSAILLAGTSVAIGSPELHAAVLGSRAHAQADLAEPRLVASAELSVAEAPVEGEAASGASAEAAPAATNASEPAPVPPSPPAPPVAPSPPPSDVQAPPQEAPPEPEERGHHPVEGNASSDDPATPQPMPPQENATRPPPPPSNETRRHDGNASLHGDRGASNDTYRPRPTNDTRGNSTGSGGSTNGSTNGSASPPPRTCVALVCAPVSRP